MDDLHRMNGERLSVVKTTSYSIDEAIQDAIQRLTDESVPDARTSIQYWIWTGTRLVRASPDEDLRLRQQEVLEQEELRLLSERQRALRQERRQACYRFAKILVAPLRHLMERFQRLTFWRVGKASR